jgi:hypothetical protein
VVVEALASDLLLDLGAKAAYTPPAVRSSLGPRLRALVMRPLALEVAQEAGILEELAI